MSLRAGRQRGLQQGSEKLACAGAFVGAYSPGMMHRQGGAWRGVCDVGRSCCCWQPEVVCVQPAPRTIGVTGCAAEACVQSVLRGCWCCFGGCQEAGCGSGLCWNVPRAVLAFRPVETTVVARPWCTYQCTEVVATLADAGTQGLVLLCLQGGEGAIRVALCTLEKIPQGPSTKRQTQLQRGRPGASLLQLASAATQQECFPR